MNVESLVTVRPDEAAAMTGLSRSAVYVRMASGEFPSFRAGRRRLIPVDALKAWAEQQAAIAAGKE